MLTRRASAQRQRDRREVGGSRERCLRKSFPRERTEGMLVWETPVAGILCQAR
jgi:hypothetical protein